MIQTVHFKNLKNLKMISESVTISIKGKSLHLVPSIWGPSADLGGPIISNRS